jgi:hypothetical protein
MDKEAAAVDAVLHEFDFVSSVIPLYRGAQFRIVAFGLAVYGAIGALLGNALRSGGTGNDLMLTVVALLPWFQFALVGALTMSEMRIVRTSHYLSKRLYPRLQSLTRRKTMDFERQPSGELKCWEMVLASSFPLFIILAVPALVGVALYAVHGDWPIHIAVPVSGGVALFILGLLGTVTTFRHELRRPEGEPGCWARFRARMSDLLRGSYRTKSPDAATG